jgi:hypothetical protein
MTAVNSSEQKAAAHRMADIIKSEIDDEQFRAIHARRKAVKALACHNEKMALAELSDLKIDASVGRADPVFRPEEFGGGSVEALIRHTEQLDERILGQISRRRPLPTYATGFSPTAMIFLRLRGIYWANQAGRLAPAWTASGSGNETRESFRR